MYKKIRKAVFPVGGLGTRFLPATKAMPKEMLPIVDKPLIQYAVEEAIEAGIEEIIFVTGKGKTAIEDHFDYAFELENILTSRGAQKYLGNANAIVPEHVKLVYTPQGDPIGLGHAVACAQYIVGEEPFAVVLADDIFQAKTPCLKQMVDQYAETGENIVSVMEVEPDQTKKYGILDPGQQNDKIIEIKGLVEKPAPGTAPSNLAINGRYILQPEIFDYLKTTASDEKGELQLTDAIVRLMENHPVFGMFIDGQRFDCGDKIGWLHANLAFGLKRDDLEGDLPSKIKDLMKDYS